MKRWCFLVAIFLISTALFAHTLVLKNGKKVEGTLINEDAETYQIRDSQGIIILVKKSQVDAEATLEINIKIMEAEPSQPENKDETSEDSVSVANIARETREKKKGAVRVLRKEDLDKMPELSIIGTEETGEENKPQPEFVESTRERSEEDWKKETRRFGNAIRKAEDDLEVLGKECDDLGKQAAYALVDPTQYIMVNGVWIPIGGSGYDASIIRRAQEVCLQAEQAQKQLARLREELEEFQDYARREGALPGWVDPDRLR